MLPITPLSLRLSCQGLSSPPTCRHWTAIAAPKHSRPHKRRLNTPQWCRAHQRKTSPHQRKKLQQYPHRLASPRAPPMSVLDLASQQLGAWTPSRLFSPSSQGFTHTNCLALVHLLLLLLRALFPPVLPDLPFVAYQAFLPHFPGQCSACSGRFRALPRGLSRLADCRDV